MPLGPTPSYKVIFNGYQLPGYVQEESTDFNFGTVNSPVPYSLNGSVQQYAGIHNKIVSLRLKVWEQDLLTCKTEIARAADFLMSRINSPSNLYVGYTDRHLTAVPVTVRRQKETSTSSRTLEYDVDFNCRPYFIGETTYTISGSIVGTGTTYLSTSSLFSGTRNIGEDGTWTPVRITLTGTNVTISGYTEEANKYTPFVGTFHSEQTGFISVSGAVTNMQILPETLTATINGANANDRMLWTDYSLYVAPSVTHTGFKVTGTNVSILMNYENRWAL
jgi:hypothetical protein